MSHPTLRAALAVASVFAALLTAPAAAQQYGAPAGYGTPYRAPPSYSERRPLDDSPRAYRPAILTGLWQGAYIGGHAGYAWSSATPLGTGERLNMTGGGLGVHAGYNWQMGRTVLGVEGDGTWHDVDGRRTFSGPIFASGHNDWTSSLRLRAGIAHDNFLFYVTGGAAFAGYRAAADDGLTTLTGRDTLFGYVAGAGVEMKLGSNVSGRLEALHYGFNDRDFDTNLGKLRMDAGTTTVRAGLTFHLN